MSLGQLVHVEKVVEDKSIYHKNLLPVIVVVTRSNILKIMVSRAGLEPATTALKVRCSTN